MSDAAHGELRAAEHFAILVYPFRHELSGSSRRARLEALGEYWRPWWSRLEKRPDGKDGPQDDPLEATLDDTWFFLPAVRRLLFPETERLPPDDPAAQLPKARELAALSPHALDEKLRAKAASQDGVLRLTYDPRRLPAWALPGTPGPGARWKLTWRGRDEPAVCELAWIDAALFPQNVGLLLLRLKLAEAEPTIARLRVVLSTVRQVLPKNVSWQMPQWEGGDAGEAVRFQSRDLIDFLLQGMTEVSDRVGEPRLKLYLENLQKSEGRGGRYTARQVGQGYGQACHLFSYACLTDSPPDVKGEDPLASPLERALYELATGADSTHPDWRPDPREVRRLQKRHRVALWENWQGMALQEKAVFLGRRSCDFLRCTLLRNMEEDYFHLYMLAVFQKARLRMMFDELIDHGNDLRRDLGTARKLWNSFVRFQTHCWFNEVTRAAQGHQLYRHFRRGLNVLPVYQELSEEVRGLQEHYERINERSVDNLLAILTIFGLPLGLLSQIYGSTWEKILPAWWWTSLIAAAVIAGGWALRLFRRKKVD